MVYRFIVLELFEKLKSISKKISMNVIMCFWHYIYKISQCLFISEGGGVGLNITILMFHLSYHITTAEKEIRKKNRILFSHCIIKRFTSSPPMFLFPYHNSYGLNINSDVFIVFDTREIISLNIFYEFLPI